MIKLLDIYFKFFNRLWLKTLAPLVSNAHGSCDGLAVAPFSAIGPSASSPTFRLIRWSKRLNLIRLIVAVVDRYLTFFVFHNKRNLITITDLIWLLLAALGLVVHTCLNPLKFF